METAADCRARFADLERRGLVPQGSADAACGDELRAFADLLVMAQQTAARQLLIANDRTLASQITPSTQAAIDAADARFADALASASPFGQVLAPLVAEQTLQSAAAAGVPLRSILEAAPSIGAQLSTQVTQPTMPPAQEEVEAMTSFGVSDFSLAPFGTTTFVPNQGGGLPALGGGGDSLGAGGFLGTVTQTVQAILPVVQQLAQAGVIRGSVGELLAPMTVAQTSLPALAGQSMVPAAAASLNASDVLDAIVPDILQERPGDLVSGLIDALRVITNGILNRPGGASLDQELGFDPDDEGVGGTNMNEMQAVQQLQQLLAMLGAGGMGGAPALGCGRSPTPMANPQNAPGLYRRDACGRTVLVRQINVANPITGELEGYLRAGPLRPTRKLTKARRGR